MPQVIELDRGTVGFLFATRKNDLFCYNVGLGVVKISCSKIAAPSVSAGLLTRHLRSGLSLKYHTGRTHDETIGDNLD